MGKYDSLAANRPMPNTHQLDDLGRTVRRNIVQLNSAIIPGAPYFMATWYCRTIGPVPEAHVHDFDEYVGFVGTNPDDTADLGGVVRFSIAGKWLTLTKSAIVFVPAGVAHCPYYVEDVRRPILHFSGAPSGKYEIQPPERATLWPEEPGKLVSYDVRPPIPGKETPATIMRKIVWLDDSRIKGAPYFEIMFFVRPRDPLPPTHVHDFDEILGFLGSDPDDPENLGGCVRLKIEDDWLELTKSSVIHIPAGLKHSPFVIERMSRPIVHFSGGPNIRYDYS
jgi:hypothetical protein